MLRLFILLISFLLFTQTAIAAESAQIFNKQLPNEEIKSISISQDGKYIATVGDGIYFFSTNGTKIWSTPIDIGLLRDVATNGEYVAVGYSIRKSDRIELGYVRLYSKYMELIFDKNVEPGSSFLESFRNPIIHVSISNDGTIVASSPDKVYILDKAGNILQSISIGEYITDVAISPNKEFKAVSFGNTVQLFDDKGSTFKSFKIENGSLSGISLSDNGNIAILTSQTIFLYQTDKKLWGKNSKYGSYFTSISISSDGDWIAASTTNDGAFLFYKNGLQVMRNPTSFKEVSTNGRLITGVKMIPPNSYLYLLDTQSYKKGSISVISTEGADVYLDDKLVGTVPLTIPDMPVGAHTIKITKQGYENWVQNLNVSHGEKKEISQMLVPLPTPTVSTPFQAPTFAPTPTLTPTPDTSIIPRNTLGYIILVAILTTGFIYLAKRNFKLSENSDTTSSAPRINIDPRYEPFIGGNCPYCGDLVKANSMITVCPDCETPHHQECWEEHGGCTTFGCKSMPETKTR